MNMKQKKSLLKTNFYLYRDRNWLEEMYIKRKLSIKDIARIYGHGHCTILVWLKKLKIPIRNRSEAMKLRHKNKKMAVHNKGSKHHNWKGGKFEDGKGGILIYVPNHPAVLSKKRYRPYINEHRLTAEKAMGRYLKKEEIIHHINGVRDDNRNCNLLICNKSYHTYLHHRMTTLYMKEHFGGGINDKGSDKNSNPELS